MSNRYDKNHIHTSIYINVNTTIEHNKERNK